ncbi:uncharacterized protein LOC134227341 [Armigeres subalbatus]|uniref:uncharacterized protein LOC134227341 n=1 Tax=Armigeres subalbatus TaxID=124917 RepID=UPI002ED69E00
MHVLWRLIAALFLTSVGLSSAVRIESSGRIDLEERVSAGQSLQKATYVGDGAPTAHAKIVKRDATNGDSNASFWGWLTGRENPDPCMMASVGGVVGGGALTGAFVGAGIGSIFTGPGTIIGAFVGGIAGLFGGVSIGHRAGAAVCDKSCGNLDQRVQCYA